MLRYQDDDVGLRLLFPHQMDNGDDALGYHVRCVAMVIGAHQENDRLFY